MSLREKLFGPEDSLRNRLAKAVVGVATRSTALLGDAIGTDQNPDNSQEINQMEIKTQKEIARASGYKTDDLGNRTERLPLFERLEIATEYPDAINEILSEEERKLITISQKEDENIIDTVRRVLTGREKEKIVTINQKPREVKIVVVPDQIEIPEDMPNKPPEQFLPGLQTAVQHLNRFNEKNPEPSGRKYEPIDINNFVSKIATEGNWNPTAGNRDMDWGMTQINKGKREDLRNIETVWGKSWRDNFQEEYGKFNEDNPTHQLLGASVILAVGRQKLYEAFEAGEIDREPTQEDIFVAYNMDYKQVIDAIKGKNYDITVTANDGSKVKKKLQQQYQDYLNALKSKGFE